MIEKEETKRCTKCEVYYSLDNFYKKSNYSYKKSKNKSKYRSLCKSCTTKQTTENRQVHQEKARKEKIKKYENLNSGSKNCTYCKELLTMDNFKRRKGTDPNRIYYSNQCNKCTYNNYKENLLKDTERQARLKKTRKRYKSKRMSKEKARDYRLRKLAGITLEYYNSLPQHCSICKSTERLCADHCHKTGEFRSILCGWCNSGLGQFKDSPDLLIKASQYLMQRIDFEHFLGGK